MSSLYARLARSSASTSSAGAVLPTSATSRPPWPAQDDELDAAFADAAPGEHTHADDDDDVDETHRLVSDSTSRSARDDLSPATPLSHAQASSSTKPTLPSLDTPTYDFERDPTLETLSRPSAIRRSLRGRLMPGSLYSRVDTLDSDPDAPPPRQVPSTTVPISSRVVGTGIQNDGVFSNLSAKPDGVIRANANGELEYVGGDDGGHKDETLPTYDSALLDSTPPYWETTVTLPGGTYGLLGPEDVLVEGLPVGNLFGFAWNLLVSMSFQFVGFLLTYLLHTTHAAKNGSRSGLGITLIQYGLYLRTRANELAHMTPEEFVHGGPGWNSTTGPPDMDDDTDPWGLFGSPTRHDWDGSTRDGNGTGAWAGRLGMSASLPTEEQLHMSSVANEWISYVLMVIGWFLLLGGMLNYWRAVRWARAVRGEVAAGGTTA